MEQKPRDKCFIACNAEDFLSALTSKEDYIIIQKDFKKEFEENTQLPLTKNEQMGYHFGSRGTGALWEALFHLLINSFSKGSKQQKEIDSKIRKYSLTTFNDEEILLYLRQLEY
ncbi:hypothetical protein MUN88_11220 [Gracilibacillus caseinilyticus]|uniref:Uncharacterized protein n=1 Tax=Gracilibacillus caseinilyticus TaxID=2932256 RepID=A0ABY4EQE4_9BACI|nr:hypothetical protein [Gracilibacillus caseinilyticus]UOQ46674.1 hypothetical protein MUN88_11220 [Gracilibacillus caseinilyticus]